MWRWLKGWVTPEQVDVDEMLSSAPLGSIDVEVETLSRRVTRDQIAYLATEPVGLLESDVIVTVEWSKERYISLYDRAGRLIAIRTAPVPRKIYYFMESGGVTFSVHPVPAGMTTPHGRREPPRELCRL